MPQEALIMNIKSFDGDIMYVPRINICPGYTAEWLDQHKFNLNEMGWINFPDYQGRYYKNNGSIKWESDLHEKTCWEVKRLPALTLSPLCPSFTSRLWSAKTNKGSSTTLCNLI
jgi:hypothetical protein